MGLFDKIKNMFTEEEEEYEEEEKEPIKKEVFQVEIPAPKIEEKKEEVKEEPKREPKKEEKFVFPVYIDDEDFTPEPPKKAPAREPYSSPAYAVPQRPVREERYQQAPQPKEEPKKKFKLSPVISPVYGILDKNYKKEDIIEKKREPEDYFGYKGDSALKVDRVRKKAYGTLEDELESTLSRVEIDDYKDVEQVVTNETKEELEKEATASVELEDMFFTNDMTLEDAINQYDNRNKAKEVEEEKDKDDLIESDLFNLIDSMYDKETKEEE